MLIVSFHIDWGAVRIRDSEEENLEPSFVFISVPLCMLRGI